MEPDIIKVAIAFAKKNKNKIAKECTNINKFIPDVTPISVFMAGSPGAGKTEYSKILIRNLQENINHQVVRIDADEIRVRIPGYVGNNSHLFHGAVSLIVEKIHDYVLRQNQTFILDGTLSHYDKAVQNIKRSLSKKRQVFIFYIYQKPEIAWKFTVARELEEGRNIPKEAFIEQFINAKNSVKRLRQQFGNEVVIFLVKKDFLHDTAELIKIEPNNRNLDEYLGDEYTRRDLEELL